MLLLNGERFVPTANNSEHEIQKRHYEESVKHIRDTYGKKDKVLTIIRRKEPGRNASGMLEETAPMVFPSKAYQDIQFSVQDKKAAENTGGTEVWAYSKSRPDRKNVGDDFEPNPNSIKFMSYFEAFHIENDIELIYFLLYKSPRVYFPAAIAQGKAKKGDLMVDDKDARDREKVAKQRDSLKLQNAVFAPDVSYPLYTDENLRKVAAAWGIDGASDLNNGVDNIRLRLEDSVKRAEAKKSITGEGKGFKEFFELCDFDDSVRARSLIMHALDTDQLTYDEDKHIYAYGEGGELLHVPEKYKYESFDYLATHLSNKLHSKEWELFKKEVIDSDYLKGLSFGDLKWLAKDDGLPVAKKSTDDLREDLCNVYCG